VLQRPAPRRVPQRALVHPPATCPVGHRGLAPGIQRGAAEEGSGRADAKCLREAIGIHYHQPRTLNRPATETGGASRPPSRPTPPAHGPRYIAPALESTAAVRSPPSPPACR